MRSAHFRHVSLLAGAIAATAGCLLLAGPAPTTIAWGVIVTLAGLSRIRFLIEAPPRVQLVIVLYVATYALWIASDLLRVLGPGQPPGTANAGADLAAAAGALIFSVVILLTVFMRGRPRIETWLDALIFAAALAPGLWLAFLQPAGGLPGEPWVYAWAASTTGLLLVGSLFLISGGIWNPPAVALVAGVVGNVIASLVLRMNDPAASAAVPHLLPGMLATAYVARHPDLDQIFVRGGRPAGIPLDARVWMLVGALSLPLGALGWTYVDGDPAPISLIAGSVGAMALIVAIRAVILMRMGVENWSVPLTISLTALIVSGTAVAMSTLNQSAQRAQLAADGAATLVPDTRTLDGQLQRAVRGGPDAAAARRAWRDTVTRLRRGDAELRASLQDYVVAAAPAMAYAARGDLVRARSIVDGPAARAEAELAAQAERSLEARRAEATARGRSVRLFSVSMLAVMLVVVAGLLLRFNAARRRVDLLHQATHDELTGLPNRAALDRELAKAIPAGGPGHARALAILDLDDFKAINDALGRQAGDAVITAVARRLEASTRSDHMLVRVDGDAFAVLVPAGADALTAAQRMLATLTTPIDAPGGPREICGSVGVAHVAEADEARHMSAFRDAELAMYQAKRAPGNSVELFSSHLDEKVRGRLQLVSDLRAALTGDGLHIAYQPIVDLRTGQTVSYEALVRWNHPTRGQLSPAEFIPVAEESGLIVDLGAWVLRTATAQLAAWQREWQDDRYVSVNVAAAQFTTGALVGQVADALRDSGLSPAHLLLEVTESALIEDIDVNVAQLDAVRELGVRVALDDFGTGYSSLSYLRRFPVDVVKVDKAFIDALDDPDGYLLVRAIVDMATSLRLRVVAEGIEQVEQAAALQEFGCELGQGYHFSRPVSPLQVQAAARRFSVPPSKQLRALP